MPKYQSKPGVEVEALEWPGFTADPWPDEQTLFFRPWHPFQIIRASYASGAYTTELRAHGTWCDLPDGHFIVKSKALDENGRPQFFPSDPETFNAQWAPV